MYVIIYVYIIATYIYEWDVSFMWYNQQDDTLVCPEMVDLAQFVWEYPIFGQAQLPTYQGMGPKYVWNLPHRTHKWCCRI